MVTRPRNLPQADPYFDSVVLLAPFSGEDGDTSATDLSNNAITLTFNGSAALDGDIRKFGFTSLSCVDAVTFSAQPLVDAGMTTGDWTVEFWYRPDGSASVNDRLFQTRDGDFFTGIYIAHDQSDASKIIFGLDSNGLSDWDFVVAGNGGTSVTTNVWHHIALVRNGNDFTLYKDGTSALTTTFSNSLSIVGGNNCIIGAQTGGTTRANGGWIENFRITSVARYTATFTPPERAYPTVNGQNPVTDGLMINLDPSSPASYPGSGTTIYDLSPNDNDGTLVGSPTISGGIIQMDGIDDSISFTSIDISHTDKVSIDFWCKLNTYVETDATVDAVVFEMSPNYNSSTVGFTTTTADDSVGGYNNTFPVSVNLKGNIGYNAHGYNKTLVNDLAWHHWCCIFDKSVSGTNPIEGRLYIDGIEQSVSQFPVASVRQDNTNNFGNVAFYIGSRANTVANIDADWGSIRLYDRVLTDGEVRQNFEAHRNRYGV